MTIGHISGGRPFRPQQGGGGSKPGKPQKQWPLLFRVLADALVIQFKGSMDAFLKDRTQMPLDNFQDRLDLLLPGWQRWHEQTAGPRSTNRAKLLHNRVYKMYYFGSSAHNGETHDPRTRAAVSPEHWTTKVAVGSPLRDLHDQVLRGLVVTIPNWKEYL